MQRTLLYFFVLLGSLHDPSAQASKALNPIPKRTPAPPNAPKAKHSKKPKILSFRYTTSPKVCGWSQDNRYFVFRYKQTISISKSSKRKAATFILKYAVIFDTKLGQKKEYLLVPLRKRLFHKMFTAPVQRAWYKAYQKMYPKWRGKRGTAKTFHKWLSRHPLLKMSAPKAPDGQSGLLLSTKPPCGVDERDNGNTRFLLLGTMPIKGDKPAPATQCKAKLRWHWKKRILWRHPFTAKFPAKGSDSDQSTRILSFWRPDAKGVALVNEYLDGNAQKHSLSILWFPPAGQFPKTFRFRIQVHTPRKTETTTTSLLALQTKWNKLGYIAKSITASRYRGHKSIVYAALGYKQAAKRLRKTIPGPVRIKALRKHAQAPIVVQLGRKAWRLLHKKSKVKEKLIQAEGEKLQIMGWSHNSRFFVYSYQTNYLITSSGKLRLYLRQEKDHPPQAETWPTFVSVHFAMVVDTKRHRTYKYMLSDLPKKKGTLSETEEGQGQSKIINILQKRQKKRRFRSTKRFRRWLKKHPLLKLHFSDSLGDKARLSFKGSHHTKLTYHANGSVSYGYHAKQVMGDKSTYWSQDYYGKLRVSWKQGKTNLWTRYHREPKPMDLASPVHTEKKVKYYWRPDIRGVAVVFTSTATRGLRTPTKFTQARIHLLSMPKRKKAIQHFDYNIQVIAPRTMQKAPGELKRIKNQLKKRGFRKISFDFDKQDRKTHVVYYHKLYKRYAQKVAKAMGGKTRLQRLKTSAYSPIVLKLESDWN